MRQRHWLNSGIIVLACAASLTQAQTNGGFEIDADTDGWADDWTKSGNVSIQTVGPDTPSPNNYAIFREPGSGGLSRIYQTLSFDPANLPTKLEFKFGLFKDVQTRGSDVPPDSFTVFLINTANSTYLRSLTAADPSFIKGFIYQDSDGNLLYNSVNGTPSSAVTVSEPDTNGMRHVRLNLDTDVTSLSTVRLEFGFANAANGVNSYVVLDDISSTCTTPDGTAPVIQCPEDLFAEDNQNLEETGEPGSLSSCPIPRTSGFDEGCFYDNCPNFSVSHDDDVHCGCPTVVFRIWTTTDASGNTVSCSQKITDLAATTDYYECLSILFIDSCFFALANDPNLSLETRVGGGCSVAELFTQCLRVKMHAPGHLSVCADRLEKALQDAGYFPGVPKGQLHNCVTNQLNELYDALNGAGPGELQCTQGFTDPQGISYTCD